MTTLPKAIKEAGISIPVNRRIWQWLKDQGPHTGSEIAKGLNISTASASSMLSQMADRKMVSEDKKVSQHLGRAVTYYGAIGKTFVLLPLPKKQAEKKKEMVVFAPVEVLPKKSKVEEILDSLSVVDAYDLYKRLDGMFNQKIG